MARTWTYLTEEESKLFKQKAENMNMSEYELSQKLIRMFLNVPIKSNPNICIDCQYYQVATNEAMQFLRKANDFLSVITPSYVKNR